MNLNFSHPTQCIGAVTLFFAICFLGPYANAKSIEFVGRINGNESDLIYPVKRNILVFSKQVGIEIVVSNNSGGPKTFNVEVHDRFGQLIPARLSEKTVTLQPGHRQKLRVLVNLKNLEDNVFSVCFSTATNDNNECGTYKALVASAK